MRSLTPRLEHSRSPPPLHRRSISPRRSRSPSYDRNGGRRATRSISRSPSPDVRSTKIVVERLTKNINENHLRELFGSFGEIVDMDMPMNRQFGTNRGTAYILYEVEADADQAIAHMHEAQLDGAVISVSIAQTSIHGHERTFEARHQLGVDLQTEITTEALRRILIDLGRCPDRARQGHAGVIQELTHPGLDPREGAVGGGITKAEMGLGGEVQVTVATAAIAVGAGAEPSQTGREGRDRWEGNTNLPRLTSPVEEALFTVHIMASNATPKPETAAAFPSKLSRSSTAAPVLVTAPMPSIPDAVDGLQETPVTPVITGTEEGKTAVAETSGQVPGSSERESSPVVADVEENPRSIDPLGEGYTQDDSPASPDTGDSNARATRLSTIIPPSTVKPYQTGIQVPSQIRIADGFPYPPGLAAYEILEEDWNKFTTHLTTLISPHGKWVKNIPIRLVPPFGTRDEKHDFQTSLSKVFEYVRASQNNLFRPKGLLMRVDIPGEDVGMDSMDLYHGRHVDHLSTPGTEDSDANAGPSADSEEIDATAEEVVAQANVAEPPPQLTKAQDKTLEKAKKKERRTLNHLNSAKKKMSKRIRIVMEPVAVLDNAKRAETNGWIAWIRHCDNYGSQLTN
ncbi:hypothetical protein V490_02822 [Pseudogymnoascus sp. VKM F-3557]|nr:hypothetical protein V490_02822 [Pseudogymnoascus sp. VKM F-3557]